MDFHFANAWELIADEVPDAPALRCEGVIRTWREYDERAARVAGVLSAHGLAPHSKVGICLHNSNEYSEAQFGVLKHRGVPINVNYRYKAEELVYLLDNADAQALIYQGCYAPRIEAVRAQLPKVQCFIQVDDASGEPLLEGAIDYERALAAAEAMPRIERPGDDIYMIYTGGTTGLPKGVMYPIGPFCRSLCAGLALRGVELPERVEDLASGVRRIHEMGMAPVSLPACPQMHGTGMWIGTMVPQLCGGSVVAIPTLGFDPDQLWRTVEANSVTDIVIVGDAFARPMLDALDDAAARGEPYDLSSVGIIASSGVMWSAEVKEGLLRHKDMLLYDAMGSSEGAMGAQISDRASGGSTARFALSEGVKVFDDGDREVQPGSGEVGMLATAGGAVPIGYYKDPEKSARTFREIEGVRYSFPGDYARVEADGTIILLGRGSQCINTGGEKVFPEEVEEAVKRYPGAYDCLVVGLPDERFGERVVAVIEPREGARIDETALAAHLREHLAGYKVPRGMVVVPEVERAPNGKADYAWAKRTAEAALLA